MLQGFADGSFLNRVRLVDEATGEARVDQAHLLDSEVDPEAVWAEVETIVRAIDVAPMAWSPDDPLVSDYLDFDALDAEVALAKDEARTAGLLPPAGHLSCARDRRIFIGSHREILMMLPLRRVVLAVVPE